VIGNPLETTIALSHLIFEGTFDRLPKLKVIGAHGDAEKTDILGRNAAKLFGFKT
jgi:predicted TIM-barrel fold metal-dependent hydrolase